MAERIVGCVRVVGWSLRYPLIDGQGNTAMRYTEIKVVYSKCY
ncbi:MAG: hypothetical protein CA917_00040 [Candidatus Karelsulcia muelleri]|nr:MAG: hypothetical protein CA917_00040 [Candidatus Karelsulcia muelleri]